MSDEPQPQEQKAPRWLRKPLIAFGFVACIVGTTMIHPGAGLAFCGASIIVVATCADCWE